MAALLKYFMGLPLVHFQKYWLLIAHSNLNRYKFVETFLSKAGILFHSASWIPWRNSRNVCSKCWHGVRHLKKKNILVDFKAKLSLETNFWTRTSWLICQDLLKQSMWSKTQGYFEQVLWSAWKADFALASSTKGNVAGSRTCQFWEEPGRYHKTFYCRTCQSWEEPARDKGNLPCKFIYSSGPNNSVVLNKHGSWTIYPKLMYVWSEISMWSAFSITYSKEFCTKTKDYFLLNC